MCSIIFINFLIYIDLYRTKSFDQKIGQTMATKVQDKLEV